MDVVGILVIAAQLSVIGDNVVVGTFLAGVDAGPVSADLSVLVE